MDTQRICSVEGCGKHASHREWCNAHYKRWQRHGDPVGGRTQAGEPLEFLMKTLEDARPGECIIWPYSKSAKGRGKVYINGKTVSVHRIACEHRNGPAPSDNHDAAHNCGKGHLGCFSPFHMRWATPASNSADRLVHGTLSRGDKHPNSKLTEDQVREVRRLYATGEYSQRQLAERFRVSRRTIGAMTDGQNWRWMDAA